MCVVCEGVVCCVWAVCGCVRRVCGGLGDVEGDEGWTDGVERWWCWRMAMGVGGVNRVVLDEGLGGGGVMLAGRGGEEWRWCV